MRLPDWLQSASTLSEWGVAKMITWLPLEGLRLTVPNWLVTLTLAPLPTVYLNSFLLSAASAATENSATQQMVLVFVIFIFSLPASAQFPVIAHCSVAQRFPADCRTSALQFAAASHAAPGSLQDAA